MMHYLKIALVAIVTIALYNAVLKPNLKFLP